VIVLRLPDPPAPAKVGAVRPPRAIRTVREPIFKNQSADNNLTFELKRALIREIEAKTPLQVVAHWIGSSDGTAEAAWEGADSELTGTIRAAGKPIWPNTWGVTVEIVWTDRRTGKTLLGGPDKPVVLDIEKSYNPELGESLMTARSRAIATLAEKIAKQMEAGW
jgi:hypothetical protein